MLPHVDKDPDLSVVVPVLNEAQNLVQLAEELREVFNGRKEPYEVIFVNDGSSDETSEILDRLSQGDPRFHVVHLRKTFGKSAALAAGFSACRGREIATLDGDLQDDPKEIPRLLGALAAGADMVVGWRNSRADGRVKVGSSWLFNRVTSLATKIQLHDFNCGLKVMRREVTQEVRLYGELHRFFPALVQWKGFQVREMPVNHRPRRHGFSKYGAGRYFQGFVDLFSVMLLHRYTRKPTYLFWAFGLGFLLIGTLGLIFAGLAALSHLGGLHVGLIAMLGICLFWLGVQFLCTGLLGELMVKLHEERGEGHPVRLPEPRGRGKWPEETGPR